MGLCWNQWFLDCSIYRWTICLRMDIDMFSVGMTVDSHVMKKSNEPSFQLCLCDDEGNQHPIRVTSFFVFLLSLSASSKNGPTNEKDIKEVQATKKEAGNGTGHSWECEQEGSLQLLKSSLFQYKFLIVGSVFLCTGQNWVAQSLINIKRIYISNHFNVWSLFWGLNFDPSPVCWKTFFLLSCSSKCSIFFTMHSMTQSTVDWHYLLSIWGCLKIGHPEIEWSTIMSLRNSHLGVYRIPHFQTHPKKLRLVD